MNTNPNKSRALRFLKVFVAPLLAFAMSFNANAVLLEYTVESGDSAGLWDFNFEIRGEAGDGDFNPWVFDIELPSSFTAFGLDPNNATINSTSFAGWAYEVFQADPSSGFPAVVSVFEDSIFDGFSSTSVIASIQATFMGSINTLTDQLDIGLVVYNDNFDFVGFVDGTNLTQPSEPVSAPTVFGLTLVAGLALLWRRKSK
jgi:hypothetical protein